MGCLESEVLADPMAQLERWLAEAVEAGIPEPNAMVVATVDADGTPSARIVLLKGLDASGVTFFTNLSSRKGQAIAHEPRVSLVLPWHAIERQVRLEGDGVAGAPARRRRPTSTARPYGSRIGAWASPQSGS